MSYRGPLGTIVLTNLINRDSFDVICFHSHVSWSAFKEYAAMNGIGYERINEDTAAKILYANIHGVGYGCYTMHGVVNDIEKTREFRMALARSNKADVARYTGICSIFKPVELHVTANEAAPLPKLEKAV